MLFGIEPIQIIVDEIVTFLKVLKLALLGLETSGGPLVRKR